MKKILALLCLTALILTALTACGSAGTGAQETAAPASAESVDPESFKVMEDVYALVEKTGCDHEESYSDTRYAYAFEANGSTYRVWVDLPQDVSEKLWAIDWSDTKDQEVRELMGPMEFTGMENISEKIPSQQEMDALVGKKGGELFEEGWTYWYYNLEDMEAGLTHGPFNFMVRFAYDGEPMINSDDFDFYAEFEDLTVESVTFDSIDSAAYLED